jgi:hypothetical protein
MATADQNDKVRAATDALADLFQDEDPGEQSTGVEEAGDSKEQPGKPSTSRDEPTTPEGVYEANPAVNAGQTGESSFLPSTKKLDKSSPVDLYGCDEMNPPQANQEAKKAKAPVATVNNVKFQLDSNINEQLLAQLMSNNQQSNYSNVNYLMRRERSLDRCPQTESYIDNYIVSTAPTRRSYNGVNQSPLNAVHQSKRQAGHHRYAALTGGSSFE